MAVPKRLLEQAKGNQKTRAEKREVRDDFHDLISEQGLFNKWNANKECVHCGTHTRLIADITLYSQLSMDKESPDDNYTNPLISCLPCNHRMRDYDKSVVLYALVTGKMALHDQRADYIAYLTARLNDQRQDDLEDNKYHKLANWEEMKKELEVDLTEADVALMVNEIEEITGQKYCQCSMKHCPLRLSWDRINSDLPHIVSNLQGLLACMNLFKSKMPDSDFRILMKCLIDNNKGLIGTEPPKLDDTPTGKVCAGQCNKWKILDDFYYDTKNHDKRNTICSKCVGIAYQQNKKKNR